MREYGLALADSVLAVLDEKMKSLSLCVVETRHTTIRLPFQSVPDEAKLRAGAEEQGFDGELNRKWLKQSPEEQGYMPMRIAYMKLATGLSLLSMNGEVVVQYGLYLKQQFPDAVLPMGYSNGLIAYIPTAAQLREGGNEAWEATKFFGMPSPFSESIEPLIRETAVDLIRGRV